jgi:hypothetical protein
MCLLWHEEKSQTGLRKSQAKIKSGLTLLMASFLADSLVTVKVPGTLQKDNLLAS